MLPANLFAATRRIAPKKTPKPVKSNPTAASMKPSLFGDESPGRRTVIPARKQSRNDRPAAICRNVFMQVKI